jgi:hypothetical protein
MGEKGYQRKKKTSKQNANPDKGVGYTLNIIRKFKKSWQFLQTK